MAENTSDVELIAALMEASSHLEKSLTRTLSNIKGISFSEYQLLSALQRQHNATATRVDLARAVRLTASGVTRALRPLEKRRYVKTNRDPNDARRSLATLTSQGQELLVDSSAIVSDVVAGLRPLGALSASGRKRVTDLLLDLARD